MVWGWFKLTIFIVHFLSSLHQLHLRLSGIWAWRLGILEIEESARKKALKVTSGRPGSSGLNQETWGQRLKIRIRGNLCCSWHGPRPVDGARWSLITPKYLLLQTLLLRGRWKTGRLLSQLPLFANRNKPALSSPRLEWWWNKSVTVNSVNCKTNYWQVEGNVIIILGKDS